MTEPGPHTHPSEQPPRVEVLGVRHHGPGSARSVASALEELRPDVVVIEGPPELDALVESAADPGLVPPVAALAYAVDRPRAASFYPLAVFSPEWVALRWAVTHGVPVRFADLPAAHALAEPPETPDDETSDDEPEDTEGTDGDADPEADPEVAVGPPAARLDPIGTLARAAGYDDPERWWEDVVEHRSTSSLATFAAIREAMGEVRAAEDRARAEVGGGAGAGEDDHVAETLRREAAMRRVLRAVLKDGAERVAVVCGAYHAPVLDPATYPPVAHDNRRLAKLPRTKVAVTWAPWTARRLSAESGYGAGVTSPGWYQHLFTCWAQTPGGPAADVVSGWLSRVARVLRAEGVAAPPASVVETVRLAEALAVVRGRPSVGLSELTDATVAVLCEGSELPLDLVRRELVIGEELGLVPDSVPLTPLAADLARRQRSLRLKPSASTSTIVLDLRKEAQRERSLLLRRLRLLGVGWATEADAGPSAGTFKEAWDLCWEPELAVAVIEAGLYGTEVPAAAEARVAERAGEADADLGVLGGLVQECLAADLPGALAAVVAALGERTARQHDTLALLASVEPLARARRYGDVRGVDTGQVVGVVSTVVARACVGLRAACASLDDDAAARMRQALDGAHRGVSLLADPALETPWRGALAQVAAESRIHGLVGGRANRLLLDAGELDPAEVARRLSRRMSPGTAPVDAASWLDGFLEGDALLLLHDPALLGIVDEWVAGVDETTYEDLLPLLRRTFARFEAAERRQIGRRLRDPAARERPTSDLDVELGRPVALRVAALLGLRPSPAASPAAPGGTS